MGCDIHAFVEVVYTGNPQYVKSWGALNLSQDYALFGWLAGVRSTRTPFIAPRGLPSCLGIQADLAYWFYTGEPENGANYAERGVAESWVKSGASVWRGDQVSDPDAHTPSWLTLAELLEMARTEHSHEFGAAIAAMGELSRLENISEVRLVFWFDN